MRLAFLNKGDVVACDESSVGSSSMSWHELVVVWTFFLSISLVCIIIGNTANIDVFILALYFIFVLFLYIRDPRFIVQFFWIIIVLTLNIVGVFVCDQGVFLTELKYSSWYSNSLAPIAFIYILFFGCVELYRLYRNEHIKKQRKEKSARSGHAGLIKAVVLIGIAIEVFLIFQVAPHPYFSVGMERLLYAQNYMSPASVSLRTYLPLFIPAAAMCGRGGDRRTMIVFLLLLLIFYFLEGDKFGAYFFAAYLFALSYYRELDERTIKKTVSILATIFFILIAVVHLQRVLLFNSDLMGTWQYLSQRLAQQGEVWWSVFTQLNEGTIRHGDFYDEISVLFTTVDLTQNASFGQWKMMSVASGYSEYSMYRILSGNPYTATTTASVFYYFGWLGIILFYSVAPLAYAALINNAASAFSDCRILESMVYVKLISIFGGVINSSDLTYLFSIQGFFYVCVLCCLVSYRQLFFSKEEVGIRLRRQFGKG